MSRSKNHFLMTATVLKRLQKTGKNLKCRVCRKPVEVGDRVVSVQAQGARYNHYIYHQECYEKIWI